MWTFLYPVQETPEKLLNAKQRTSGCSDKTQARAKDNMHVTDLTAEIRQM